MRRKAPCIVNGLENDCSLETQTLAEIHLAHAADLKGWRAHVRALLADNTAPSTVAWNIQPPPDLFESNIQPDLPSASIDLKISREHAALISAVIQSSDAERFRLLHQFVYGLHCNTPSDAALEARLSELHEEAQKPRSTSVRSSLRPSNKKKIILFSVCRLPAPCLPDKPSSFQKYASNLG